MYHVMHINCSPEGCDESPGGKRKGEANKKKTWDGFISALHVILRPSTPHPSHPPSDKSPVVPKPLHPFLEIFSGRNCAVLKQIYFNTWHNIWTNKTKKKNLEHFYILLSRSKKKENWTLGFSIVCQFCILTSSLQRLMYYFAIRRRRHKGV